MSDASALNEITSRSDRSGRKADTHRVGRPRFYLSDIVFSVVLVALVFATTFALGSSQSKPESQPIVFKWLSVDN